MDKKESNHNYFQNNKDRIYTNYKKCYNDGNNYVSDKSNRYIKHKQKYKHKCVVYKPPEQYVIKPKIVDRTEVRFGFD